MGRPKKNQDLAALEAEVGLVGGNTTALESNEMPDDYTLEVSADYDPSADIFRIQNKDPRYSYRYLRDEAKNISIKTSTLLYQKGGWQLVPKAHLLRIGFKDADLSPDGFRRIGEHVLAFMPKHLYEKKEAAKVEKTRVRTSQITRLQKDGDPSVGGKEMHQSMKGIQPAHKLGMGTKRDDLED